MLDSSSNVTLWTNIFRETESLVNPFFFAWKKQLVVWLSSVWCLNVPQQQMHRDGKADEVHLLGKCTTRTEAWED